MPGSLAQAAPDRKVGRFSLWFRGDPCRHRLRHGDPTASEVAISHDPGTRRSIRPAFPSGGQMGPASWQLPIQPCSTSAGAARTPDASARATGFREHRARDPRLNGPGVDDPSGIRACAASRRETSPESDAPSSPSARRALGGPAPRARQARSGSVPDATSCTRRKWSRRSRRTSAGSGCRPGPSRISMGPSSESA